MDGGPHPLPGYVAERHGGVGRAQVLPDRQIRIVTADAKIVIAGPKLELAGVDVEQRRPGKPAAQARGHAVGQVEKKPGAGAVPQILGGCAEGLLSSGWAVALMVGEEHKRDPVGDAERLYVSLER